MFFFVDGLGLAPASRTNPVNEEVCPTLCRLIAAHGTPIDACLGVPGLPQSATGQATMLTGINASRIMGRHVEGFPGPSLRRLVERDNLFLGLKHRGKHSRFADAYLADSIDEIRARRFRSVTTTISLSCPEVIALRAELFSNQAICHDITRESLMSKGYDGPLVTPQAAGEHLVQIALAYDFTLFEFFQTDRVGHAGNYEDAAAVLRRVDAFLEVVCRQIESLGVLFILTSDHGNIEAIDSHGHTTNPVPLIAKGPGADILLGSVSSLVDVTPRLLRVLVPETANGEL